MELPAAAATLERDLRGIFGARLHSVVAYGLRSRRRGGHGPAHATGTHDGALLHTLAVVDALSTDDLRACAARVDAWHDGGLDTPLLVSAGEFARSLDAFPFEFGTILADYSVVSGRDPFESLRVEAADLRRACEIQARGHLLHLREAYIETRGRADALALMIEESAPAFAALVTSVARLDDAGAADAGAAARHVERRLGLASSAPSEVVALAAPAEIAAGAAERLFAPYLESVERLVGYVDAWRP